MRNTLLLYGLQSPINIGMLLRVAEVYQRTTYVFDVHRIFKNEAALKTISDFSTGALQRCPPKFISNKSAKHLPGVIDGRILASSSSAGSADAWSFDWKLGDCIVLGNEYDGLPAEVERAADAVITIPMPDGFLPKPKSHSPIDPSRAQPVANFGKPSLNVATAGAILSCAAYCSAVKRESAL